MQIGNPIPILHEPPGKPRPQAGTPPAAPRWGTMSLMSTTPAGEGALPPVALRFAEAVRPVAKAEPRLVGLHLFGSHATGEAHPASDVDLGALFATRLGIWELLGLEARFEDALGTEVDLVDAGESFLRRALETLLDLGRHLFAKGFGVPAVEYKEIARVLGERGVLEASQAELLRLMAGYRNRLVHFCDEVSAEELYAILTGHRDDIAAVLNALEGWLARHPERVDPSL